MKSSSSNGSVISPFGATGEKLERETCTSRRVFRRQEGSNTAQMPFPSARSDWRWQAFPDTSRRRKPTTVVRGTERPTDMRRNRHADGFPHEVIPSAVCSGATIRSGAGSDLADSNSRHFGRSEQGRKVKDSGFRGTITNTSLHDVIQLICIGRNSCRMLVRSGPDKGWIYFRDGEIVHAECAGQRGEDAFYTIVSWELGLFECDLVEPEVETIRESWDFLLMESMRRLDRL